MSKFTTKRKLSLTLVLLMFFNLGLYAEGNSKRLNVKKLPPLPPVPASLADVDKFLAYIPEVIAKIGDEKVYSKKIVKMLKPQLAQGLGKVPAEQLKKYILRYVNMQVEAKIFLKLMLKSGGKLDFDAGKKQLNEMVTRMGGEEQLSNMLKVNNMTKKALLKEITENISIRSWIKKTIVDKIVIDEKEAKIFFKNHKSSFNSEEIRASHILIKSSPSASKDEDKIAKKKIQDCLKRIKKGEDFATVAKEVSEGPSAAKGGDLSFFKKGMMVPAFEKVAWALKKGEVSEPVKTQFGYHIIKLTDRKSAEKPSFEKEKEKIKSQLRNSKINDLIKIALEKAKKDLNVKIFLK